MRNRKTSRARTECLAVELSNGREGRRNCSLLRFALLTSRKISLRFFVPPILKTFFLVKYDSFQRAMSWTKMRIAGRAKNRDDFWQIGLGKLLWKMMVTGSGMSGRSGDQQDRSIAQDTHEVLRDFSLSVGSDWRWWSCCCCWRTSLLSGIEENRDYSRFDLKA